MHSARERSQNPFMKAIEKSYDWKNEPGFDPIAGKYLPLNTETFLKRHRIREEGTKRGKLNQPGTQEDQPDDYFSGIVSWVTFRALDCRNSVQNYINNQLLASLNNICAYWQKENPEDTLEASVEQYCQNLDLLATEFNSDLSADRRDFADATHDLNQFREKHRLPKFAVYPQNTVVHWLWVPVVMIIESFAGANLLGSVSRGGVIEGWILAIVLTVVNVLLGLLAGMSWRYKNCKTGLMKTIPIVGSLFCSLLAACWNVLAGHVRDVFVVAEQSGMLDAPDNALATAWQTMLERPVPWESLSSAGLAIVGIAVFALTTYKSYTADDPFPGYGKKQRLVEYLRERYQLGLNMALEELKATRDNANEEISKIQSRYEMDRSVWMNTTNKLFTIVADFEKQLRQYDKDLAFLLRAYMTANLAERTTDPPPYFNEQHSIEATIAEAPTIEMPSSPNWENVPAKIQAGFERIESKFEQLKKSYV